MVRVSIRIRNGAARFNVAVQAQSIQRALSIVQTQHRTANVEVEFPTDPERSFVEDRIAPAGLIEHYQPKWKAA